MMNRPYLDQLATSAHLPKQPGQNGYCSKTLIPDLSCTGLRSELEPIKMPITTQDGKMTKQYRIKAYSKIRECQRGLNILNAQEDIFKLDHRLYIDSLLGSIEHDKKDKHERRMRHWKKDKSNLGFSGSSFDLFHTNNINYVTNDSNNNEYHEDFESHDSFIEYGTVISANEYSENEFDSLNSHVDSMKNKNRSSKAKFDSDDNNNITTKEPLLQTTTTRGNNKVSKAIPKKIKNYSTMALFESLLENTSSPSRKFGGGN